MAEDGPLAAQIVALETRIAHQDFVIEELNGTVTALWARVERLTRLLTELGDRLRDAEAQGGPANQRPPHY